jgi:hypothetical protein
MDASPEFTAQIEYADDVNYNDAVDIKRDGTTEWKGFVEDIDIVWDAEGRYLNLGGRDTSYLLWRKYTENFTDMAEDTEGFFGSVNSSELIEFLLRCPCSDLPTDGDGIEFANNKQGWGIDVSRIRNVEAYQTSYGDINWAFLRKRGLGWRNVGDPYATVVKTVDGVISCTWDTVGTTPYIEDTTGADWDTNYIKSHTGVNDTAEFSFTNFSAENPRGINDCRVVVVWKPDQTWWSWIHSNCEIQIWVASQSAWLTIGRFGGKGATWWATNPWRTAEFDLRYVLTTVADINAAKVKFIELSGDLSTYIANAHLSISYVAGGSVSVNDWVEVSFEEEDIVGVYIESRMDDDSYPKNYKISTRTTQETFADFDETDPNTHIVLSDGDKQCDFDSYTNESAWLVKDYGANGIEDFDYLFSFKVDSIQTSDYGFIPFCITDHNNEMDYYEILDNDYHHIALEIERSDGVNTLMHTKLRDASNNSRSAGTAIVLGTRYWVRVVRSVGSLVFVIFDDQRMRADDIVLTTSYTLYPVDCKWRYRYHAMTYNDGSATHTAGVIYTDFGETVLINKTNNTYRDIIHSWKPTTMSNLKITITQTDATRGWGISQIYIYKAENIKYRVYLNHEDESEPTPNPPHYVGGPYIKDISIDSPYVLPIGPLNISQNRLFDAINEICTILNSSYVPYEWWIAYDTNNTFHMSSRRGSDLSATVSFVKGTNLEGATRSKSSRETVQRTRVIGRGEGKRQDDVSSPWIDDTDAEVGTDVDQAMDDIQGFIEDVDTQKEIANVDISTTYARVRLMRDAAPKDVITCRISNDTYSSVVSLPYDVGDDVTVTDSLVNVDDMYRIYNIKKVINDKGEIVTLYVNAPYVDVANDMYSIFKKLKQLGIVGTVAADWCGEASDTGNINAEKLSPIFAVTAKDEVIDTAENDKTSPKWLETQVGDADWDSNNDNLVIYGGSAALGSIEVTAVNEIIENSPRGNGVGTTTEVVARYVSIQEEPKFTAEFRVWETDGANYTNWANGDFAEFGMYDTATDKGFFFRIEKENDIFTIYAVAQGVQQNIGEEEVRKLRTLVSNTSGNQKYKCEIIVDYVNHTCTMNVYDVTSNQTFPVSAVFLDIQNVDTRPIYLKASGTGDLTYRCIMHFYDIKCEKKVVGP